MSHTCLSLDQQPLNGSTLPDVTQDVNDRQSQTLGQTSLKRWSLHQLAKPHTENSESCAAMSGGPRPRYMTATLASNAQGNTPQRQSRPTTPASAGSTTEKRGWMVNAGRRLGITTPKSRGQDGVLENRAVGRQSPGDGTSVSKKSEVSFSAHA